MPAKKEENLDDVIADLIDSDEEDRQQSGSTSDILKEEHSASAGEGAELQLTPRAAKQIRRIRAEEELSDELYLRVAVEGGGCSGLSYKLGFDNRTPEDQLFESQDVEILVDRRHLIYLEGITVDYPDGLDARGFTFNNPNASESCGCGASFAV
ncbi:MAG: iron-sulfur cluster assembly accessory protein [Balneolaceae bacterium]|nr:iron-sulfur cluster assembly accessory protein [Balneolaceae bacterium]